MSIKTPNLVVNGSNSASLDRARPIASRESGSDESGKADSSSELGTKPPSLDGKSITSGTTFALDEKESLRPDDSASVKAAAEDDDAFSIRGSLLAGSRMGSDAAFRARHLQLGDLPDRRLLQPTVGSHGQGVSTPPSASSEQPPSVGPPVPLASVAGSSDALGVIYRQAPDEKLLEALASPRDRLFLLRLEKDVIGFVQDSKEPYMDLPPSNSFCRMLTHKLADYYHMTHSYEPHIGSVRIFRTPFCRVPPSLALMSPQSEAPIDEAPPPVILPKKIMRRGQSGEGGGASASPSKPTSEDGVDGKEKQANQKLTREEREEMYKIARERIFGNSEESVADADESGISRASSVSANNRSTVGKRGKIGKQRRDDSESWDSRNQYTPFWGPQQQTWVPQQQPYYASPPSGQFNGQPPPSGFAGQQVAPVYGQQNPAYGVVPNMPPNANHPAYPMAPYSPQPGPSRYPPGGSPMASYGSPVTSVPAQQNWQPGFTPPTYPAQPHHAGGPQAQGGLGVPYAFGQLPANINPYDPKSQHPIPGSYNRNHAFNPKTQSFIPGGNGMPPVQSVPVQPLPPFPTPGSHHSSPRIGTSHLAFQGYQHQPQIPQPYVGAYNMARQGSNHSMPGYHAPQHMAPPLNQLPSPMMNLQHTPPPQHMGQNPQAHLPRRPNLPQGPNQIYSHLPNYGNPATLPQRPTTGI
ncbi:hypothetical protein S7711_07341 [Stachybotrys chartarum IBT 7711]|uniref:SUZ domain-containing protein n=1 Tax=Stachybotrys chartarum (strain CBS 109288 / IBT 7711) TaxID=1280523 RepID=A0A084AI72_STACB|nr:hypothetical protein S7711_07341 [Stachybotrys chartarum IBT 7711]KFA52038.1 hypothetical protein S40293_02923 [Stachybotrys chartarum IBT 40293]